MSQPAAACSCWQIMWTMDGNLAELDSRQFVNLGEAGKQARLAECVRCGQRWLNANYPVASEGWHPVRS